MEIKDERQFLFNLGILELQIYMFITNNMHTCIETSHTLQVNLFDICNANDSHKNVYITQMSKINKISGCLKPKTPKCPQYSIIICLCSDIMGAASPCAEFCLGTKVTSWRKWGDAASCWRDANSALIAFLRMLGYGKQTCRTKTLRVFLQIIKKKNWVHVIYQIAVSTHCPIFNAS